MQRLFFHSPPDEMHMLDKLGSFIKGGGGAHTAFVHRGRQNKQKIKAPCSSFNIFHFSGSELKTLRLSWAGIR